MTDRSEDIASSLSDLNQAWVAEYSRLRKLAQHYMNGQNPGHTLQATVLVNEAFVRLTERNAHVSDQAHLHALASRVLRQVLVDHARSKKREKRGGSRKRIDLDEGMAVFEEHPDELLALHEALGRMAQHGARQLLVVEMRFFGGLSMQEIADAIGVAKRTVESDWRLARTWLYDELYGDDEDEDD